MSHHATSSLTRLFLGLLRGGSSHRGRVTINALPDDVIVDIFYFYLNNWPTPRGGWHTLVHVCQRWRSIVFASPRLLNLRLEYTGERPMPLLLDLWPVLPVAIISRTRYPFEKSYPDSCWGNIVAFLESEHHHRICVNDLYRVPTSQWERLAAAMQSPFPDLTFLRIFVEGDSVAPLPDSFLGGSAPLLRHLALGNCPFPAIPKLFLSTNHLVVLSLWNIPHSGYFSPQDLVTALSVTSKLEILRLRFQSPRSRPDPPSRPRPPPLARTVLPALTYLAFQGVHEYLEDLLARVEAPLLNELEITFFMDLDFVVPQLHQLISHTDWPQTCDKAFVCTFDRAIQFATFRKTHQSPAFSLEVRCKQLDYQLASLVQVCGSSLRLFPNLVQLDIVDPVPPNSLSYWKGDLESAQWLELLQPFTAVKDLRLTDVVARHVCQALEELAEDRVTQVLPALHGIFLSDLAPGESVPPKSVEQFVAARRLSGHSVVVYPWRDRGNYEKPSRDI